MNKNENFIIKMRNQLNQIKQTAYSKGDYNYLSKENNAKIIFCSSESKSCSGSNVLINEKSVRELLKKSIWLSDKSMPQSIIFDVRNLIRKPKQIRFLGIYCCYAYNTNPKILEVYLSSDSETYTYWGKFHASFKSGNQFFAVKPFNIDKYKYFKLTIKETYGGNKTYLNKVFLFENIPENKRFKTNVERKAEKDYLKRNFLTSIENIIEENQQECSNNSKNDIQKIFFDNSIIKTQSLEKDRYFHDNPNLYKHNNILEYDKSQSYKTNIFKGTYNHSKHSYFPENEGYKNLKTQLQEMECELFKMRKDHELNILNTNNNLTSNQGKSNPFSQRNNEISLKINSCNSITDKNNNFDSISSSSNFDKLQTFGERIDKLQYFIAELRNEYKEIKHKAGDFIIHKNKSDLPKQIEKTDEYKDIRNNRVEIIDDTLEEKLTMFLEGIEEKVRFSVENAIKDKLETISKTTNIQESNETPRKIIVEDNNTDENISSIQDVFEELYNKLKEKEKKLKLLEIETTKNIIN